MANVPTVAGPIIWFLAVAITPFGMPQLRRALANGNQDEAEIDKLSDANAGSQ